MCAQSAGGSKGSWQLDLFIEIGNAFPIQQEQSALGFAE